MYKNIIGLILIVPVLCWAAELVDPTKPPAYTAVSLQAEQPVVPGAFNLTAILLSAHRKIAVINGEKYNEGEALGSYKIKTIESYKVLLANETEEKTIMLGSSRLEKRYQGSQEGAKP